MTGDFRPQSHFLSALVERGFVQQCSDLAGLDHIAKSGDLVAYIGFDCTAPRVDAPTEQHIEIADLGRMLSSREPSVMFGCYEAWKNIDTASGDRKVVVASTILLATIF